MSTGTCLARLFENRDTCCRKYCTHYLLYMFTFLDYSPRATFQDQGSIIPEKSRNYEIMRHLLSVLSAFIMFSLIYDTHVIQFISRNGLTFYELASSLTKKLRV